MAGDGTVKLVQDLRREGPVARPVWAAGPPEQRGMETDMGSGVRKKYCFGTQ